MSVYHNVNGVIKEVVAIYENVNGVIHKIDSRYQNVNGVIRQTYSSKQEGTTKLLYGGTKNFLFRTAKTSDYVPWAENIKIGSNDFKYIYINAAINGGTASYEGFYAYISADGGTTYVLLSNHTWESGIGYGQVYTGRSSYSLTTEAINIIKSGGTFNLYAKGVVQDCDFTYLSLGGYTEPAGMWLSETAIKTPPV